MLGIFTSLFAVAVVTAALVFDHAKDLELCIDHGEVGTFLVDARMCGAIPSFQEFPIGDLAQETCLGSEDIWNDSVQFTNKLLFGFVEEGFSVETAEFVFGSFGCAGDESE
jgi:hypothetical protein